MTIKKHEILGGFTQIPNDILNNENISFKAKGIWAYIWGKPDGWDFAAKRMAQQSNDGEKSVLSGITELEQAGYIKREKLPSGRIKYHIFCIPQGIRKNNPEPQKGVLGIEAKTPKRQIAKTANSQNGVHKQERVLSNKEKKEIKKNTQCESFKILKKENTEEETFRKIFKAYRDDKKKSFDFEFQNLKKLKNWREVLPRLSECLAIHKTYHEIKKTKARYIPLLSNWISQETFEIKYDLEEAESLPPGVCFIS